MVVRVCLLLAICHCPLINLRGAVDAADISSLNEDNLDILARPRIPQNKVASTFRFFKQLPQVVKKQNGKELKHSPPSSNTLRKIPKIPTTERELDSNVNANVKAAATENLLHSVVKSMETVLDAKIPKLRKISKENSKSDRGSSAKIVHEARNPEFKLVNAHQIFKKMKVVENPTEQVVKGVNPSSNIPREKENISSSTRVLGNTERDIIEDDVANKHMESIVKNMKIILDAKENNAINFKKIPILKGTTFEKASPLPSSNSQIGRKMPRLEDIVRDNIKATVTEKHLDSMVQSMQTVLGAKIPKLRKIEKEKKVDGNSAKKTLATIVRDNIDTAVSDAHLQSISKSLNAVVLARIPKGGQRSKGVVSLTPNTRVKSMNIPTKNSKFENSKIKPEAEHLTPEVKSVDFEHERTSVGTGNKPARQIPGLRTSLSNFNFDVSKKIRTTEVKTNHPASSVRPETTTHARIIVTTTPSPSEDLGPRGLLNKIETNPVEAAPEWPHNRASPPASIKPLDDGKDHRESGVNRVRPHKKGETIRGRFF